MIEIVIDTNILLHAENEKYKFQNYCISILNIVIQNSDIYLCLDENRVIEGEYNLHVKPGTLASQMLLHLLTAGRIKIKSRSVHPHINRKINQTGIKKNDRCFVRTAYNCNKKFLISDEHEDFTTKIRAVIKKEIGVLIQMSHESMNL